MGPSIKLKKELWERVKKVAEVAGYSSPQEFVSHVVEKELAKLEDADSDEKILDKLKGLGYID
jgi:predicted DNA-binding protein